MTTARTKLEAWVSAFFGVELADVAAAQRRRSEIEARPVVDPVAAWHADDSRPHPRRRK